MPALRVFVLALVALGLYPISVAAQRMPEPRIAAAVSVGRVTPLPFDLAYSAPTWSASVQWVAAKHLLIEGAASGWRHTTTVAIDDDFAEPQFGFFFIRQGTQVTRDRKMSVSANALAFATLGRVRLTSGVGAGPALFRTVTSETDTVCASSYPPNCRPVPDDSGRAWLFSVQAVLGVDVAVTSRLRASLTYRLSQPFTSELGDASVLAGLIVGLR